MPFSSLLNRTSTAPSAASYFAWKGCISCCVDVPVGPELFDPNLGQQVKEFFEKLIPLYEYFSKF